MSFFFLTVFTHHFSNNIQFARNFFVECVLLVHGSLSHNFYGIFFTFLVLSNLLSLPNIKCEYKVVRKNFISQFFT